MKDYSGYIIAVLFVLFLSACALYDAMLQAAFSEVQTLRGSNRYFINENIRLSAELNAERMKEAPEGRCLPPEAPPVVVPTFGDGSTVRYPR